MKMYTSKDASNRKYNLYVRLEKDKKIICRWMNLKTFQKKKQKKEQDSIVTSGIGDVIE